MTDNTFYKDPDAELDWEFDWSSWLATGETISSSTVTVQTGLTAGTKSATTTAVTQWLSGGTADTTYTVACKIVTSAGRTDERTIYIHVTSR